MARDFDGVDDEITFGSDAGIDNFAAYTFGCWVVFDTVANFDNLIGGKGASGVEGWSLAGSMFDVGDQWQFVVFFSGVNGAWLGPTGGLVAATRYYVMVTYDGSDVANDPIIYQNGATPTLTETTPTGTLDPDSGDSLRTGMDSAGSSDFDGRQSHLLYDNRVYSAAEANRCRWWGVPGGAVKVYHPMLTSSLVNKGTAVADGTAAGTTMISMPTPTVRPGSAMMGLGVGW